MKNKKIRIDTNSARGALYRASTLDDSVEVDEEYDSDFGEEHFDDECVGKLERFIRNMFSLHVFLTFYLSGTYREMLDILYIHIRYFGYPNFDVAVSF